MERKTIWQAVVSFLMLATLVGLFCVGAAQAASILVSWNSNSEADLAGYNVYYGTESRVYGDAINTTDISQLLTLTPDIGTTYYFAVTAYDTSGNESDYSEEVSLFVGDGTPPGKVQGIKAIIQAVISWIRGLFGLSVRIV